MSLIITRTLTVTLFLSLSIFNLVLGQVKAARDEVNVGQKSQKYSLGLRISGGITKGHFPKNLPDTILAANKNKAKPSFSIQGQLTFPLKSDYSYLVEAGYMRGGRRVQYSNGDWQNNFSYNFLSTSMSLRRGFKVAMRGGRYTDLFVNIGPNINYLMNGKMVITTSNGGRSNYKLVYQTIADTAWTNARKKRTDIDKYYFNHANRFFFGLDIGAGIYVPVTAKQKVFVELRLTLGGTYIRKRDTQAAIGGLIDGVQDPNNPNPNPKIGSFQDPLTTNMKNLSLSVAYTFDFDKKDKNKGKSTIKKSNQKKRRR